VNVVSFILFAYLILLNAVPCCAIDHCADELTGTEQSANHESDDKSDCSNCSPFFTCSNCTGLSVSVSNIDFTPVHFFSKDLFTGYILVSLSDMQYDFWQPPRQS
jgi:hypothetical protein